MSKLAFIKAALVIEEIEPREVAPGDAPVVSVVDGVPVALDGVMPVITVCVTDPERDAAQLLRAAEQLLPLNRQAAGVIVLDDAGDVQGVVPRPDLEEAVLEMRRGAYGVLARRLGLRTGYRPPAGDPELPFVYWRCPQCRHVIVPAVGHEDDPPTQCRLHVPPAKMERRVHGAE